MSTDTIQEPAPETKPARPARAPRKKKEPVVIAEQAEIPFGDEAAPAEEIKPSQASDPKLILEQDRLSEGKVFAQTITERYSVYHGDSCEIIRHIPSNSVHFQVMSPPFVYLFVYSASDHDLGNCKSYSEFFTHYKFLIGEQLRVAMPGRLCAIHVQQLATSKTRDGFIGMRDFRGECIRAFEEAGWIYHSEVCIWKNPAVQMIRTKALRLLHKQLKKDSCMSGQGFADYLVVFRKPGDNPERVTHTNESFPVPMWQRYASPVWATSGGLDDEGFEHFTEPKGDDGNGGIDQGDTLNGRSSREHKDERHLCTLQLPVIRRAINLWSNPGDVVASWFSGIASEGYVSLQEGRKFIGCELKESYYKQGVRNLAAATISQSTLF